MKSAALIPLAEIPSPTQSVWYLGPVPIRAYALCIVLGIVAACAVTEIRMRRRGAPPWVVLDVAVWAVPFGIVGARIYHVITSPDAYFGRDGHPLDAFAIWHGGLGIWGGVAGGALGAWIAARRMGIPLAFVAGALAPGLPLAQAIGRWGNWFNNELYGGQTTLPWGLKIYQTDPETPGRAVVDLAGHPVALPGLYHPTFLYESLWNLGVAILVWQLDKRYRFGRGRAFALYVMAYTVGRFWVEMMRDDPAHHFFGMRVNNWTSILVFIGALIYFVRVRGPQERLVVTEHGQIRVVTADGAEAEAPATAVPASVGAASAGGSVGDSADKPGPVAVGGQRSEPEPVTGAESVTRAEPVTGAEPVTRAEPGVAEDPTAPPASTAPPGSDPTAPGPAAADTRPSGQ